MDNNRWLKDVSHLFSMCISSPLNPQVLFCDGHVSNFDYISLNILCIHQIQYLILKSDDFVHEYTNNNGTNFNLNNLHVNKIMNWMRKNGNLKFMLDHMNAILVETWEYFKISSASITHDVFKKTYLTHLSPPEKYTNHQACLAATQVSKRRKTDDIGSISKARIAPIDM